MRKEATVLSRVDHRIIEGRSHFPNGTRKALIDPALRRTEYAYDAQNRVKSMTTSDALTTTYSYHKDDLVHRVTQPNGVVSTSTYDDAGRLDTLVAAANGTLVSEYDYDYDTNGNRTRQVETLTSPPVPPAQAGVHVSETTTYTYDNANRLKSVTYPTDLKYPLGRVVTYTYDKVGNRVLESERTHPPQAGEEGTLLVERVGAFDASNQLRSLATTSQGAPQPGEVQAFASYAFDYDANGNELFRTSTTPHTPDAQGNAVPSTILTTLSRYDRSNRLTEQVRFPGQMPENPEESAIIGRHEYDGEGRRIAKHGEDGLRLYAYDDTSILAEYNEFGTEVAKYDYGADRLIRLTRAEGAVIPAQAGIHTLYYSFDGLGSVTSLTSPTGTVAATYHLDAWGNYRFTSELAPSKNRFGYTGHYWDNEAGLYYAKARYYDPFTARFTQADSFLGKIDDPPSLHRYFYANANPTFFTDPTGHSAWTTAWKVIKNGGHIAAAFDNVTKNLNNVAEATSFRDRLGFGLAAASELLPVSLQDAVDIYSAVQENGGVQTTAMVLMASTRPGRAILGGQQIIGGAEEIWEGNVLEGGKHILQGTAIAGSVRPKSPRGTIKGIAEGAEAEAKAITIAEKRAATSAVGEAGTSVAKAEAPKSLGATRTGADVAKGESGIYRFPDQANPGSTRSGMATDLKGRLGQHRGSGKLGDPAQATVTDVETYGATGRDARRLRALAEQEQREALLRQNASLSDVIRSVDASKRQALEALRDWYRNGQQGPKPSGY